MRVSVVFSDAAMGCPARMTDPQQTGQIDLCCRIFHFGHTANPAHTGNFRAGMHRNAGGIVTTVFQPLEPFDQNRHHITLGNRTDNPAHLFLSPECIRPPAGIIISTVSSNPDFTACCTG